MNAIRDMLAPLLADAARIAAFQDALNAMGTPSQQKEAIINAHCHGLISKDDTHLLFDVYDLAGV